MKHLFVPYELSVKLKEKGFDEDCIAYYDVEDGNALKPIPMGQEINAFRSNTNSLMVATPIYQQVVDWLYEKGVSLELYSCDMGKNFNHVIRKVGRNLYEIKALDNKAVPNRYDAFNKAIEEALKLLNQTK